MSQRMVPFALCRHKQPLYYFSVRKTIEKPGRDTEGLS